LRIAHFSETRSGRLATRVTGRGSLRLTLALATVGALVAFASAGAARAGGKVPVAQGIGAAALPSTAFGDTPANTPENVSFILRANNLGGLQALVGAGMPSGFLSVNDFARSYGQSSGNIYALEHYLAGFGIQSQAMADGLDVQTSGTAGEYDAALSVHQHQYRYPGRPAYDGRPGQSGYMVHGTKDNPLLPRSLARFVLAIFGLSSYPTMQSESLRVPSTAPKTALQEGDLTPQDFAQRYNLAPLYKHANGAGRTIGIVTLAALDPTGQVPGYFWSSILGINTKPNRIQIVNVDGGPGAVSDAAGSGETTLDVEQSGALAPWANLRVYQAPNTDPGFADAFFQAASDNVADSVSASWGESETVIRTLIHNGLEDPNYVQAFDEAFLELAAQGQSAFSSSGDAGAYDDSDEFGTTALSVDNPQASPWITSAGGTTLPGEIDLGLGSDDPVIASERTWGWDWLWPYWSVFGFPGEEDLAKAAAAGGGGGFSTYESTPSYQWGVPGTHDFSAVEYLTPTDYQSVLDESAYGLGDLTLPFPLPTDWSFDATPSVTHGWGNGRATPDVSTDADPFTGYEEWFTFGDQPATLETGWGGTSFVAPQLNGSTALIDSALGRRVGFWNPAIYKFAMQKHSPFMPLNDSSTNNDNLYYTGTAGHVFNVGSGLGTPDLAQLAGDFVSGGHH